MSKKDLIHVILTPCEFSTQKLKPHYDQGKLGHSTIYNREHWSIRLNQKVFGCPSPTLKAKKIHPSTHSKTVTYEKEKKIKIKKLIILKIKKK